MIQTKLMSVLLMGSTLVLTGCGSSPNKNPNANANANLGNAQLNLQGLENQSKKLVSELEAARRKMDNQKKHLNRLRQSQTMGATIPNRDIQKAQVAFNKARHNVSDLEKKKAKLDEQLRVFSERQETVRPNANFGGSLDDMLLKMFSEEIPKNEVSIFIDSVARQDPKDLLIPVNKAIKSFKLNLSTAEDIRDKLPTLLNTPFVDYFLIPWVVKEISEQIDVRMQDGPDAATHISGIGSTSVKIEYVGELKFKYEQDERFQNQFVLMFDIKDAVKKFTKNAYSEIIDKYFKNSKPVKYDTNNIADLRKGLLSEIRKLKTLAREAIPNLPDDILTNIARKIQSQIPEIKSDSDMTFYKFTIQILRDMLDEMRELSAEIPRSSLGSLSYRKARREMPGVNLHDLTIDGQSMDQSYNVGLPVHIQLKGDVNTATRSGDMSGSVSYNLNGTMLGLAQAFGNDQNQYSETSLVMSQSFSHFFAEVQIGTVGVRENTFSGWEGQRYQATIGYDATYVSPFVQLEYRPLNNGINTLDVTGVYVGLEADALKVQLEGAVFTAEVLAKVGYESATETLFTGNSLRANQGSAAFVEWTSGLKLSSGLEVKSALSLGSKDNAIKLNIAFEQ